MVESMPGRHYRRYKLTCVRYRYARSSIDATRLTAALLWFRAIKKRHRNTMTLHAIKQKPQFFRRLVVIAEPAIHDAGDQGADDRRDPEQPELIERPATRKQCRARAARRIHRRIGHGNADQMDQGQRQADREAGKTGGARLSVLPRITSRKNAVSTISQVNAALKSYLPGECSP